MFSGIGFAEILVIMIVALIVIGPKRLPEVAKSLGRFYREIRSTVDEVKEVVVEDIDDKPYHPPVEDKLSDLTGIEETEPKKDKKETPQPKREKVSFQKKNSGEQVDGKGA
ncbi:MAG: twin-arginine translocase subunit TatB [Aquificae bacterium]|nr:twin-arginine translocase subunit TatB [Aquificota bacterium]